MHKNLVRVRRPRHEDKDQVEYTIHGEIKSISVHEAYHAIEALIDAKKIGFVWYEEDHRPPGFDWVATVFEEGKILMVLADSDPEAPSAPEQT